MSQFLRDQASDSDEVVTPLMLDGTYLSRNFATLGPLPDSRRVVLGFHGSTLCQGITHPPPNNLLCLAVTSLCHVIQAKGMLEVKRLAVELRV